MLSRFKLIHLLITALALALSACGEQEWTGNSIQGSEFCEVFKTAPECNGGNGGGNLVQVNLNTLSGDGIVRMAHPNPSNPDFGVGYAQINVRNTTQQTISGNFSLDLNGNNIPVTKLEICPRQNESATTCSGAAGTQVPFSVAPGQVGYFLINVEADGTIPFVPEVNAVYLRMAEPERASTVKVPVTNER